MSYKDEMIEDLRNQLEIAAQRADKLEQDNRDLRTQITDKIVPTLYDVTNVNKEVIAVMRDVSAQLRDAHQDREIERAVEEEYRRARARRCECTCNCCPDHHA